MLPRESPRGKIPKNGIEVHSFPSVEPSPVRGDLRIKKICAIIDLLVVRGV